MRRVLLLIVWVALAWGGARELAGQVQTTSTKSEEIEAKRRSIRELADSLRKNDIAISEVAASKDWKPAKTPWGDPDIEGVYTNSDERGIPLERPAEFGGRRLEDITREELAKLSEARRDAQIERLASEPPRDPGAIALWEALNARNSRAWLVLDPPDGRIPPLTPRGQLRADAAAERLSQPRRGDSYADRDLYTRCISRGLPGSMMPESYGSVYDIHQGPGYVVIRYEQIRETRVIPVDGRPHVGSGIRAYMGDARGRWDGDALVVETTNFKDLVIGSALMRTALRGADARTLKVIERFTPRGPGTIEWSVTFDDPATWVRPWTFAMALTKTDQSQQVYEYACHEDNYSLRNILEAARPQDDPAER